MDITNKARIHWACRRGMRELDIAIMPFFEHDFDALDDQDKQRFVRLLECDDRFVLLADEPRPAGRRRAAADYYHDSDAKQSPWPFGDVISGSPGALSFARWRFTGS